MMYFSTLWFANSIEIWMIMCPKLHIPIDLADLLAKVLWCFSDSFIRTCCGGAMHTINLGLCYTTNGGALMLGVVQPRCFCQTACIF
jgi:hypothetical protein